MLDKSKTNNLNQTNKMNFKALATAALASLALTSVALPEAKAYTSCNSYGSQTTCYGSDGSTYTGTTYGGQTTFYGYDSNGDYNAGSCSSYGGVTNCYSY